MSKSLFFCLLFFSSLNLFAEEGLIESIQENNMEEFREQLRNHPQLNERDPEEGITPLIAAVRCGHSEMVEALVHAGADPNHPDENNGATPLMWAVIVDPGEEARERGIPIPDLKSKIRIVQFLLASGAKINEKNTWGGTALQWAADAGTVEIVKILLEYHADPNTTDMDGFTPLIAAANFESEKHVQIVKILIASGAKVDAADKNGNTALMFAIHNFKVDNLKTLVDAGADPNQSDREGNTPLMKAARLGRTEITRYLIDRGADVNAKTVDGKTVLKVAREGGYEPIIQILEENGAKE